jgi:hypothetical protein
MSSSSRSTAFTSSRLLVLALVLLGGKDALAAKKVVVFPFEGRGAADAEDHVAAIVERDAQLVSQSALSRARKRLGVRRIDESAIARLSADLEADAFIEGAIERRRRGGYTLLLTIHEGKTGAVTDTIDITMRDRRLSRAELADLDEKLVPALAKIEALTSEEEPIDITPAAPEADAEEAPIGDAAPVVEIEGGEEALGDESTARSELEAHRYARFAAVDVQLGVSAVRRSLSFTYAGDRLTLMQRPNGYDGSIVPSVMLTGEVYPLSFGKRPSPWVSGIGVGFVLDRVLLLKSRLDMTEYGTTQMRFGGGLRYRWNIGNKATMPTVKVIADFQRLTFAIDRGTQDIDLPNVSYSYLDLGLAGRFPLGTPMAAVYVDARYLHVLSSGELSDPMYYGSGSALGFDGDAGFELQFLGRAILRVGGRYQRIVHDFDGNGIRSNNRDGNMSDQEVGGALDTYLSGYVTAGYLF